MAAVQFASKETYGDVVGSSDNESEKKRKVKKENMVGERA